MLSRVRRVAVVVAATSTAVFVYFAVVRPWHLHWGASDAEVSRHMPGDELVEGPIYMSTRAVTIHRSPQSIWPWLVQMGESPRGGFYSYQWIERLAGLRVQNVDHILVNAQHLEPGRVLDRAGNLIVLAVDPGHYLVLGRPPQTDWRSTWTLALYPTGRGSTRLVSRVRSWVVATPDNWWLLALLDPGHFIMERKMLLELKGRAEGLRR